MDDPGRAASILVVDDSPDFTHLLTLLLRKRGYQVRSAGNSDEAMQLAESAPPELFLLDIDMPDIDGYALCRMLKDKPALQHIPVIFVSGYDKPISKLEAFKAGAVDYVNKPIHAEELGARVDAHVELYRLQTCLKKEVEKQTRELQDALTALRILSRQQTEDAAEQGRIIVENINNQVIPFVQRLYKTSLDETQRQLVDLLSSSLQEISKPLLGKQEFIRKTLTPVELQIAYMIKEGRKTKQIAELLFLSELTVATHRKNIRKKLGIGDRKVSLFHYLTSELD